MTRADAATPPFTIGHQEIRDEYAEMPCLRLTDHEAGRFFGLAPFQVSCLLDDLVDVGFLRRTADWRYARADVC